MNTLKSLSVKSLALALILGMAAGCASVTDATFEPAPEPATVDQPTAPNPDTFGNDDDYEPILEKPLYYNKSKISDKYEYAQIALC